MTLNFNKKFYKLKAVKSAIRAYRGFADFKLKNSKKYIQVFLRNIDKEAAGRDNRIEDEFLNYVLFLSLNKAH